MQENIEVTSEQLETLADYRFQNQMNIIQHSYVDITGDLVAGALLRQIIYWFSPSETTGKIRVSIKKEGYYWLAKGREEWYNEIRISPKQYDRAAKTLEDKGFIIKKRFKFDGAPTIHIRLNFEKLNEAIRGWKDEAKEVILKEIQEGVKSNFPKGKKPVKSTILVEPLVEKPLITLDFPERSNSNLLKGENGFSSNSKMDFPESGSSLTENLPENSSQTTYIDHNTGEIEAGANEAVATVPKEKKSVVVEVQEYVYEKFKTFLPEQDVIRLLSQARQFEKGIFEAIAETHAYFAKIGFDKMLTLQGSIGHALKTGWSTPVTVDAKQPKTEKKVPVSMSDNYQPPVEETIFIPDADLNIPPEVLEDNAKFLEWYYKTSDKALAKKGH